MPPPFLGGLVGYLAYELGDTLERLPAPPADDPACRCSGSRSTTGRSPGTGGRGRAWLAGRAIDGDGARLAGRLAEVRERLRLGLATRFAPRPARDPSADADQRPAELVFRSSLDRGRYHAGVEAVRERIAGGEIYQANLTRRLAAPFDGDPWPLYRRLRTGDPSLFSAYLDLGTGAPGHGSVLGSAPARPRAILSASPEPFLAVDAAAAASRPTRSRAPGRAAGRGTRTGRWPASCSARRKDRAENVMIVDVLRNDLGRVCRPGSRPRAAPLPARADGGGPASRLDRDRPAGPGPRPVRPARRGVPRRIDHGAPKIRAMEILRGLEPSRRGPYTGALGWIGPDGAMATSILIRTFVADGTRLTPPRRRRDHLAERSGGRVGRDRGEGARPAGRDRRAGGRERSRAGDRAAAAPGSRHPADAPPRLGRRRGSSRPNEPVLTAFDRGFQLGDGVFETLRARGAAARPSCAEHVARLRRSAAGLEIPLPDGRRGDPGPARSTSSSRPRASAAPTATRASGSRSRAAPFFGRGLLPPTSIVATIVVQAWPVRRRRPAISSTGLHLVASAVRRDPESPLDSAQDDVARRLRLRPDRGPRAPVPTTRCSSRSTGTCPRPPRPTSSSSAADDARHAVPRLRDPAGDDPRLDPPLGGVGRAPAGGGPAHDPRPGRGRRGVPVELGGRDPAGDPVRGRARSATAGRAEWTLRARADREAFIAGDREASA